MPADQPQLSFVIPVRNDRARLARCLDSIAATDNNARACEVIVVDNGSTDGSADTARARGHRVLVRPAGSVADLRNAGAAAARGAVLAFVDADHELAPAWMAAARAAFRNPDIAAAGFPYSPAPNSTWVQRQYDRLRSRPATRQEAAWLGSGNLAVRREAFADVGGFDTTLQTCEDVDLCQRLIERGYRLVSEPGMGSVHYGDPSGLKHVFLGELWRGRDNLRVTLRGPWTLSQLRSVAVPIVDLAALGVLAAGIATFSRGAVAAAATVMLTLGIARAGALAIRRRVVLPGELLQLFTVVRVYDIARALALVVRAPHRVRRSYKDSHVTANSHP